MTLRGRLAALERRVRPNVQHCVCPGIHPRILVIEGEGPVPAVEETCCDRCGRVQEVVCVRIVDRPGSDVERGTGGASALCGRGGTEIMRSLGDFYAATARRDLASGDARSDRRN